MRPAVKLLLSVLVLAAAGGGAWFLLGRENAQGREQPPGPAPAVPVFTATVTAKDVAVIRRGIGQVQAFNTVTVKSRVDGAIVNVAFREGQAVRAGDLLMQIDPRPYQAQLDQAQAAMARDAANLTNAQRDLERDAQLVAKGTIAQQAYEGRKTSVEQLAAVVKVDQAQVDLQQTQLDYATITSPIDGVTGIRQLDIGNLVSASNPTGLVVVTQLHPINVAFNLPEQDLPDVRAALASGSVTVEAWDGDDRARIAVGRLDLVDNQIDPVTGTVRLKASFGNEGEVLWPGQFVNAHLILRTVAGGATVPAVAIQTGPKGQFAFVVKNDQTVENRGVEVAQTEAGEALVTKGLVSGERVVTSGQLRLKPGTRVEIRPAPEFTAPQSQGRSMDLTGQTPEPVAQGEGRKGGEKGAGR